MSEQELASSLCSTVVTTPRQVGSECLSYSCCSHASHFSEDAPTFQCSFADVLHIEAIERSLILAEQLGSPRGARGW